MAVLWIQHVGLHPDLHARLRLIDEGMNWWQAVLTIFLGNVIVLVPMVLNAHAGTKYGIPFPVYCRASFGILGANVPALLRALVACGWFGIQTWIGGGAIYKILTVFIPAWDELAELAVHRHQRRRSSAASCSSGRSTCWSIYKGIESIRMLLNIKAPLLIVLGLALLAWAYYAAGGFGADALASRRSSRRAAEGGPVLAVLLPVAHRQRRLLGHARRSTFPTSAATPTRSATRCSARRSACRRRWACTRSSASPSPAPPSSSTAQTIWDPVVVLEQVHRTRSCSSSRWSRCASPRWPRTSPPTSSARPTTSPISGREWISFRIGGLITGVIGILIQPWKLVADPTGYILHVARSATRRCLGAVGGVLIADYFVIRRTRLDLAGLYRRTARTGTPAASTRWRSSRWCSASPRASPAFWPPFRQLAERRSRRFWTRASTTTPGSSASACRSSCTSCLMAIRWREWSTQTAERELNRHVTTIASLLRRSLVAIAACVVAVVICYYFVDRPVAFFVHDHEIAKFDEFRWLTEPPPLVQSWSPLVLVLLAIRRAFGPWRRWQHALFVACVSLIVADQFRESLGDLCGRYWPETWHNNNPSLIGTGAYGFHPFEVGDDIGSFPSGHAARIVGFVTRVLARHAARPLALRDHRAADARRARGDELPLRRRRHRRQRAGRDRRHVGARDYLATVGSIDCAPRSAERIAIITAP